ncbi:hypothetical protein K2173_007933 [Erythroxylum novogranatense]|uniref:NAB domain-containing protein n=1 Tax=Erythroxylum novogranatense TaxID=1862640 RepID=A0AAV8T8U9_9ROSI|nr:hypothetical protein K2173_007933 [Erythroxylum novogranatense]
MLQRAASNAYSWWWASHIRTKQSKWLEENLQDMEDKVTEMLQIIENDGDTFTQRVEMYYKKRPELIDHVEESYRSYRALAERYDKLSKELQSANRTIATVFPEQVQYSIDDDDMESYPTTSAPSCDPLRVSNAPKANIPKAPSMKEFKSQPLSFSKEKLARTATWAKAAMPPGSGLSEEEAVEEIDKLQKEILALQTEREFIQSVCVRCNEKCWKIENHVTAVQKKISSLQDEFQIGYVFDDNEARTLMAATALKSCQKTLVKLREKQEESAEEAEVENERIKQVDQKLMALKSELLPEQTNLQKQTDDSKTESGGDQHVESLREKIKIELYANSNASLTVIQLAEKIDELVEKVATLEAAFSSQSALVNRLRSETDNLQENIKILEEEKETLTANSEQMSNKIKELEEELQRVKSLNQSVKDLNNNLKTHFTEASCNADHLSEKLKTVKPSEVEDLESIQEVSTTADTKSEIAEMDKEQIKANIPDSANVSEPEASGKLGVMTLEQEKKGSHLFDTESNVETELEEHGLDEEADHPNWRKLYLSGVEDREKFLVEEYTLVLKNYKDVRKKLGDVEKKNRDGFFELALQIRELKNALALRDEEIHSLRKLGSAQHQDENVGSHSSKYKYSTRGGSPESMTHTATFLDSNMSTISSPRQPVFDSLHHMESGERTPAAIKKDPVKDGRNEIKLKYTETPRSVPTIEDKFRSDIDEMLEQNLEFWLRFSTAFHQIGKFQTSIQDLKLEVSKLKDNNSQEGGVKNQTPLSEARPIYNHLREINTDLTLWLENAAVLKEELQSRYTSLCNIHEELSKISKADDPELSEFQAAKFQGEVLNMKQESNKVASELQVSVDRVKGLRVEVEDTLAKLDQQFGISSSKHRSSMHKARIPLRSFLFGVKLKKQKAQRQSLFSCVSPIQKHYSNMGAGGKPPE